MATLKYSYTTATNAEGVYTTNWKAQTFTTDTSEVRVVKKIGVFTNKNNSPTGTLTLSIKAVDGTGHPTGSDLCSATYNTASVDSGQAWLELDITTNCVLSKSTKYALVYRNSGGDAGNYTTAYYSSSDAFANGNRETSSNSGSSWSAQTNDLAFRVYCDPVPGACLYYQQI